jgi:NDP-sugar pyrophosphorylase family protein
MSEQIQFRRKYDSMLEQGRVSYGLFEGKRYTIPALMQLFRNSDQPVEALVEAHWEESRRPEKLAFCGATYDFLPQNGIIVAQTTTSITDSEFSWGTVIHPNVTIQDSKVGHLTEVSNTSTIMNSRIGSGCLIGTNVVISGCKVLNHTELHDGTELHSELVEAAGRDFKQLAYEGARW